MDSVIITPENEITFSLPENKTDYTLEELQKIVGGYVEIIPIGNYKTSTNLEPFVMVVNEEGKLKNLSRNRLATFYKDCYDNSCIDYIVGTILICPSSMIK